ncbi:MAG: ABC transporter ATP-binding protein [Bacteroides sp.]|nr:ABC transporter ATP-binding protein [Bacteroides sp.]
MNGDRIYIRCTDLTTGYRAGGHMRVVTTSLSESLRAGEMTCLLGPNGAGKSTLMRTLAGFQKPLGGSVEILGRDIRSIAIDELARLVSVVLTERPMVENMDVEAMVGLGRMPYTGFWGRLGKKDREAVGEAIELIGIGELRHRMVQSLSDGERQKVMIAKAIAQETGVIFLDEPTAFLDYPSKVEIMTLLRSLAREHGKVIFISTHDIDMAFQIADRLWLIDRKLGVCTGTHRQLVDSGDIERYFLRPGLTFDKRDGLFKIDIQKI